jgi:hypothetical protein
MIPRSSPLDGMSFTLNFDNMHQFHPGYTALYMKNHDGEEGYSFDYIEVKKYLNDPRDAIAAPGLPVKIKAELLEDGRGMVIYEPMLATYFETDVRQINAKYEFNKAKKVAYIEQTMKHKEKESTDRIRKTYIYFPDNIIGTTEYIGGVEHSLKKRTDLLLSFNLFKLPITLSKKVQAVQASYAFWQVGVKGSEKIMEFDHDANNSAYLQTELSLEGLSLVQAPESMSS